ncbi:phage shock protein A [Polymorphobacter multimanifer]|uniref:Phage shock protein A n=2 Tax=Polymorphobacter multimanifer TaxID=1070431 RepID=A0A841L3C1_9SPHN|nr:hypothetical protein [Polymorphobacter multimanifer]MBB6226786.1 phage shock protein A [Polymorphobacter multimanifer]
MGRDLHLVRQLPVFGLLAVALAWAGLAVAQSWPQVQPLDVLPPAAVALLALALLAQGLSRGRGNGRGAALAEVRGEAEALEAVLARIEAGLDVVAARTNALAAELHGRGPALGGQVAALARHAETVAGAGERLQAAIVPVLAQLEASGGQVRDMEATLTALAARSAAVAEGETRLHDLARALEAELGRAQQGLADIETAAERLAGPLGTIRAAVDATEARERSSLARDANALMTRLGSDTAELAGLLALPVPEAVWQAWLRGDRTALPRSVRALLGEADQRMLARHLAHDPAFRTAALRFLDGFEAMVARLLGDRDGEALAATMLSGDFGALYVRLGEAAGRLPDQA